MAKEKGNLPTKLNRFGRNLQERDTVEHSDQKKCTRFLVRLEKPER